MTNQWIVKCKLNQREETDGADWQQLQARLATDIGSWVARKSGGVQGEFAASRGAAFAIGQVHRCSAYESSSKYVSYWLRNGRRKELPVQAAVDETGEPFLDQLAATEDDPADQKPYWLSSLEHVLLLSRRFFVHHDLYGVRQAKAAGYKARLAQIILGAAGRQTNLPPLLRERDELIEDLGLASTSAAQGFLNGEPIVESLRELLRRCDVVGRAHKQPNDLMTVAQELTRLLPEMTGPIQSQRFQFVCDALNRIRHGMTAGDDAAISANDLIHAAAEFWEWLHTSPPSKDLASDSALCRWLKRLKPDFPKIDEPVDCAFPAIVVEEVSLRFVPRKSRSKRSAEEKRRELEAIVAMDRRRIRDALVKTFPKESPQYRIVIDLIAGASFDDLRDTLTGWMPANARDIPLPIWEAVGRRIKEWSAWFNIHREAWTHNLQPKQRDPRFDPWIEEEIPQEVKDNPSLLIPVIEWVDAITDGRITPNWSVLDAVAKRIVRWALFSVYMDDIIDAMRAAYRAWRTAANAANTAAKLVSTTTD